MDNGKATVNVQDNQVEIHIDLAGIKADISYKLDEPDSDAWRQIAAAGGKLMEIALGLAQSADLKESTERSKARIAQADLDAMAAMGRTGAPPAP